MQRLGGWIAGAAILFTVALAVQFGGRDAVLALCTTTLIACVTPARARWITAPLTARPMLFLGSISYSLYLIHMLVIHVLDNLAILPGTPLAQFALVYAVTISLSTLTYLAIEKPTNRIGLAWHRVLGPGWAHPLCEGRDLPLNLPVCASKSFCNSRISGTKCVCKSKSI